MYLCLKHMTTSHTATSPPPPSLGCTAPPAVLAPALPIQVLQNPFNCLRLELRWPRAKTEVYPSIPATHSACINSPNHLIPKPNPSILLVILLVYLCVIDKIASIPIVYLPPSFCCPRLLQRNMDLILDT